MKHLFFISSKIISLSAWMVVLYLLFISTFCHNNDNDPQPTSTTSTTSINKTFTTLPSMTNEPDPSTNTTEGSTHTLPTDVIPPNWVLQPYIGTITYNSIDILFSMNELGTVYYKIEEALTTIPPILEDIKANNMSWKVEEADTELIHTINQIGVDSKILPDTEYTIYLLAEDATGNLQQEPAALNVKTKPYPYLEWHKNYPNAGLPESTFVDVYYKFKAQDAVLYYTYDACDGDTKNCENPISLPTSEEVKEKAIAATDPQKVDTKADIAEKMTLEGLTGLTKYIIYLVGEDENNMLQPNVKFIIIETQPEINYSDVIISYVFQSSDQWEYKCCPNEKGVADYDINAHMRFIELRNVSDEEMNIGGWSLQFYHNMTNNNTYEQDRVSLIVFPTGTLIPANKSYLVGVSRVHDVIEPDLNLINISFPNGLSSDLLNDSGKGIALVRDIIPVASRDDEDIEDQMGYVLDPVMFPYFGEGDTKFVKKEMDACGANFRRKNLGFRDTNNTANDWEPICEESIVSPMNSASISTIEPPLVVNSYPMEGAIYNSEVKFDTFTVEFNEDMNFGFGYVEVVGGQEALRPAENFYQIVPSVNVDNQRWISPTTYTFDVIGLNSDTHYQFELKDFRDLYGNEFAAENGEADQPYLKDTYLDVYTQAPVLPIVTYTFPADNQSLTCGGDIRCPDKGLSYIQLSFSEEMNVDVSKSSVTIEGGASLATDTYLWQPNGNMLFIRIEDLNDNISYTMSLVGFKDIFGYELDKVSVEGKLGDNGVLEFTTQPVIYDPRLQITQFYMGMYQSHMDYTQYLEIWNNSPSNIDLDAEEQYFVAQIALIPEEENDGVRGYANTKGWQNTDEVLKLAGGTIHSSTGSTTQEACWIQKREQWKPALLTPQTTCSLTDDACLISYCSRRPTPTGYLQGGHWSCNQCKDNSTWVIGGTYINIKDQTHVTGGPYNFYGWNEGYEIGRETGGAVLLLRCDQCTIEDLKASLRFQETPFDQWEQLPRDITLEIHHGETFITKPIQIIDVLLNADTEYYFGQMGHHGWWHRYIDVFGGPEYRSIFGTFNIYEFDTKIRRTSAYGFSRISYIREADIGRFPDIPDL